MFNINPQISSQRETTSVLLNYDPLDDDPLDDDPLDDDPLDDARLEHDVVIIGAGIGGLAACIFLQQAGLRVACVEPKRFPRDRVGESLDWFAPGLLQKMGFSREQLIEEGIALEKAGVHVAAFGEFLFSKYAPEFMVKSGLVDELTIHVDRAKFDQMLFEKAKALGVTFLWERVKSIDTEGERVVACHTTTGKRLTAKWFIDASGRARLFTKHFKIPISEYGRRKVCLWTQFDSEEHVAKATGLYIDNPAEYLNWVWEIPVGTHRVSVGYIVDASHVQAQRKNGYSVREIFTAGLMRHQRFTPWLAEQPDYKLSSCSYRSHANEYACGENWFIVGEAASMPDPLTSNGVTSAMRHAYSAATLIQTCAKTAVLSKTQQFVYNSKTLETTRAFNQAVEKMLYEWPLRQQFGPSAATRLFLMFTHIIGITYARREPQGLLGLLCFRGLLSTMKWWMRSQVLRAKWAYSLRQWASELKYSWSNKLRKRNAPKVLATHHSKVTIGESS